MFKRKSKNRRAGYRYSGGNWIICDYSGFKIKVSDARKTWDGYWVHKDFWEARHPQDFVRGRKEKIKADVVRPEPATPSTIDGSLILTGNDRTMAGSNSWTGATLGTFDVNTTVSGKMYMLGDGGQDFATIASKLTSGTTYFFQIRARLNTGTSKEIRIGTVAGTSSQYYAFTPDRTERIFSGEFTAGGTALEIGLNTGFNGIAFEIDDVQIREVNTNSVSAGSL
jgi:hypothetical protein